MAMAWLLLDVSTQDTVMKIVSTNSFLFLSHIWDDLSK